MRKKSLFHKKIFCGHCLGGCKKKKHRDVVKYLCSNYENYGKCQKIIIREDKLIKAINKRYETELSDELSDEQIRDVVVKVIVKSDSLFDIHLTEGVPISYHERGIVF